MITGLAIILSGSRAGMLSFAFVCVLGFFYFFRINKKQKIWVGVFLAIILIGLYFIKKDSANGRLLIWRCSWEIIKDKPLTGLGEGGFKANYMNYQATYFEEHPDSKYAMLADNISRPFNEYIGILVDFGFVGFLAFLLFLFFLIKAFKQIENKTILTYIAAWSLAATAVFAFFSYPLRYPFVWVTGLLSCLIILKSQNRLTTKVTKNLHEGLKRFNVKILYLCALCILCVLCVKIYSRLTADLKWSKIAHLSLAGQTEQMLPEYQSLHSKLHNNELFLYNYTAELNFAKHYEESQSIARECERLWADYDLQMLMADNCQQLKDYAGAEKHYRKAAAMCPAKFIPLYELAKMFYAIGHRDEAVALAQQIVNKPIKILSPTIIAIQREMRQLIEKENKTQNNARQGKEAASSITMFYYKGHKAFSQRAQNYYCHCVLCATLVFFVVKNSFGAASALPP